MTFTLDFPLECFEKVLTNDWQKTGEIAKIVKCSRKTATAKLDELLSNKQKTFEESGIPVDIECKWVPGGREGTRAWRLIPNDIVEYKGRQYGKALKVYEDYKKDCKLKVPVGGCSSRENRSMLCTFDECPMIIRR